MNLLGAVAVGLMVHAATRHRLSRNQALVAAVSVAIAAAAPAAVLILGPVWALAWRRSRQPAATRAGAARPDHLGQVLFIALSAGFPVAAALNFAAEEVDPVDAEEVRAVLRSARRVGLATALAGTDGGAAPLFAVLARAQLTGSSAVKAVAVFIDEDRKTRRVRSMEAAQRLPVKLTVPLALLILPGFVLLTVGPTVVGAVQRLLGPLLW